VLGTGADDATLGSVQRSTRHVRIPSGLAADLALLTDALDDPAIDIAATLAALMTAAATAVPSYVGLSMRARSPGAHVELTTVDDDDIGRITTSLRIPLLSGPPSTRAEIESVVLVLYAATAGAFVDLAADLAWLTRRSLAEIPVDDDVSGGIHLHPPEPLRAQSAVNQAIGVLIGEGRTPDDARAELGARATLAGVPRHTAAATLLASLPSASPTADAQHDPFVVRRT
jgi:hypothetical protein